MAPEKDKVMKFIKPLTKVLHAMIEHLEDLGFVKSGQNYSPNQ